MSPTPSRYSLPQPENEWIHHMLEYNTKGGKMTRGLMVVETASIIFKARYTPFRAASLYHAASLFHAASLYHAACRYPPPSSSRRAAILTMAIPTYGLLPTDYFLLPTSYLTTDYLHFTTFQLTTDRLLFTTCYLYFALTTTLKARGLPIDNAAMCKFAVLGWCIEWLQAWLLVADDIMDESLTRRGQPCWYKCKGVGHIAINDAVTIEALVFKILKRHFAQDECYLQLVSHSKYSHSKYSRSKYSRKLTWCRPYDGDDLPEPNPNPNPNRSTL